MECLQGPPASYPEAAKVAVLDFQALNGTGSSKTEALRQLDDALQTTGFVFIKNHPIPLEDVENAFEWSRRFFKLPDSVKANIAHPPSGEVDDHRGWARSGLAHVSQLVWDREAVQALRKTNPEFKETLEMGNPFSEEVPPNKWLPEEDLAGFRAFVESWWKHCVALNHDLLKIMAEALRCPGDVLVNNQLRNISHMSWAYYPATGVERLRDASLRRLNAHTDFGSCTLVFQDTVGGFEIHDGETFRPVKPIPGAVLINIGDILERQTNGRWKSALHRVVAPSEMMATGGGDKNDPSAVQDRFSLVYFGTPDPDSAVVTLPGCEKPGKWQQNMKGDWGEMTAGEWIAKRLAYEY